MIAKGGWVYIVSSHSHCLYIGVTSDLSGRVWEHKHGVLEGFTKKYKIDQLVYHEFFQDIESAIVREKQLKGWSRAKKIALIEKMNPGWKDLALPDAM
jgi:putative endonuclease